MLVERAAQSGSGARASASTIRIATSKSLTELIRSADLVVLPYDSDDQVTSGVLVDAVAAGRPVVSTAFPHAVELLASGAGIVVPQRDPAALAGAIRSVLTDPDRAARWPPKRAAWRPSCRGRRWPRRYDASALGCWPTRRAGTGVNGALPARDVTADSDAAAWRHVLAMSDGIGIFEHADHAAPRREHGYCTDDVSRLLIAIVREPVTRAGPRPSSNESPSVPRRLAGRDRPHTKSTRASTVAGTAGAASRTAGVAACGRSAAPLASRPRRGHAVECSVVLRSRRRATIAAPTGDGVRRARRRRSARRRSPPRSRPRAAGRRDRRASDRCRPAIRWPWPEDDSRTPTPPCRKR